MKADGLPNAQGAALVQALNVMLREKRLREDVAFLQGVQRTIDAWLDHKAEQERACSEQRRWFTHEQQEDFLAARPTVDPAALRSRLKKPGVAVRLGPAAQAIQRSLLYGLAVAAVSGVIFTFKRDALIRSRNASKIGYLKGGLPASPSHFVFTR
ncbi:DNA helicase IV [Stenotrophomonas maltophilia SKK35]|nr:hypothetical protein [Stenotrophomonas maltophilia]CCP10553.1 DNA helicase IV [Stenotrophomonas maltophilia SKK35]